eukprot:scaffold2156_cov115-Cylindrotheca_fusiformis.AAC.21
METMRWSEQNVSPQDGNPGAPAIKNHSVTHFRGYDGRRDHSTLLLYSIEEKRWIRPHHLGASSDQPPILSNTKSIQVTGTPPAGRNGHSATLATDPDDDDNGRIIVIGGWLGAGAGPLAASDMHVLDISHSGTRLRWYQPAVQGTPPGPCNMHSADYVAARQEVYVFRGGNGREYLNDLHALSTQTFTWRKVETSGAIPQQRANHSSAILEETGELFIFGGWNGTERLNDIHILDTATSTWTCPQVGGVLPHPRAGMTLTALRGRLYLFGGSKNGNFDCFQDLQILDRSEMAWLNVTQHEPTNHTSGRHRYDTEHPAPNRTDEDTMATIDIHGRGPGRRAGHTATAVNRKIYVFGGSSGLDYLNDFYVLDTDPPPHATITEEEPSCHLLPAFFGSMLASAEAAGRTTIDSPKVSFAIQRSLIFIIFLEKCLLHCNVLYLHTMPTPIARSVATPLLKGTLLRAFSSRASGEGRSFQVGVPAERRRNFSVEKVPEEDYYNGHLLADHLEYLEDMLDKTIKIENSMNELKELHEKKHKVLKSDGTTTDELDALFHHAAQQKSIISNQVADLKQLLMNAQNNSYAVDGPDGTADGEIEDDFVEADRIIDDVASGHKAEAPDRNTK